MPERGWEADNIANFRLLQEVVRAIRNLRSEKNVKPSQRIPATLVSASAQEILQEQAATLASLAGLEPSTMQILGSLSAKPEGHIALVAGPVEIFLPLAGLVDSGEERARLEKDLAEAASQVERLEKLLASSFAEKAPPAVVQKERDKLAGYKNTAAKLKAQLTALC